MDRVEIAINAIPTRYYLYGDYGYRPRSYALQVRRATF